MTVRKAYDLLKRRLSETGVENAAFEAACILEKHTGLRRADLPLRGNAETDAEPLFADAERRAAGEPLQYILGEWEFMGLPFRVGPGVLIPRADTELLAETGISFLKSQPGEKLRALDLCTGSGCLAVSLAAFEKRCVAAAADLSPAALSFARENAEKNGVAKRVAVLRANMLTGECSVPPGRGLDLLVCNPPYIPSGDLSGLDPSVRLFEPRLALDGGGNGLDFYRAARLWLPLLRAGGMAAFETGFDQARQVARLLAEAGLARVQIRKDLAGIERVAYGFYAPSVSN